MYIKDLNILILNLGFYALNFLISAFSFFYAEILFFLKMKIIKKVSDLVI